MALLILLGVCLVGCFLVSVAKELHTEASRRRDDRIMAAYQRQEAARIHAGNLADIDRTVRATADEMNRVAAEADGEIIEGTAVERS
jgi:hypothetical protein